MPERSHLLDLFHRFFGQLAVALGHTSPPKTPDSDLDKYAVVIVTPQVVFSIKDQFGLDRYYFGVPPSVRNRQRPEV